jgi:hypothetical protein
MNMLFLSKIEACFCLPPNRGLPANSDHQDRDLFFGQKLGSSVRLKQKTPINGRLFGTKSAANLKKPT